MDLDDFLGRVQQRTGLDHRDDALRGVRCTLGAFGEILLDDELDRVRDALPPALGAAVTRNARHGWSSVERFHAQVEHDTHMPAAVAVELAGVVCQTVAEVLPPDVLARWQRDLPPPVAALFLPAPARTDVNVNVNVSNTSTNAPASHTLASGRPGSEHPLSEAHPERAHRNSVARSDDPHADTRLASSPGSTQERLHESLAEGRPGPRRPLSGR